MDYYLILGIPRDASQGQIRDAYRRQSLRHHPDVAGAEGYDRFLQLAEAYETLRDPGQRRQYDRSLPQRSAAVRFRPGPRPRPEPLTPQPINPFSSFRTYHPSLEEMLNIFLQNFSERGLPKSRPVHDVNIDLLLTPQEAGRGGSVPLELPVAKVCGVCDGTGSTGFFHCDACGGQGVQWERRRMDVLIPPRIRDGEVIPISLRHLGVHNMHLNLHVRVTA